MHAAPLAAHELNAPGDFYVEHGCCLTCAVPFTVAPDLFAWATEDHDQCVVCKQPGTPDELDRMLEAVKVADLGCIRYKGTHRTIQLRLLQAGEGAQCDLPLPDLRVESTLGMSVLRHQPASGSNALRDAVRRMCLAVRRWLG